MPPMVADPGLLDVNGTPIAEAVAFILMVVILARYAYPRIMQVAEEREKKIEAGVRAAEEAEKRLAEVQEQVAHILDEAPDQAREIIARAHREAGIGAEEVRIKDRADAEAPLEQGPPELGA